MCSDSCGGIKISVILLLIVMKSIITNYIINTTNEVDKPMLSSHDKLQIFKCRIFQHKE